MAALLISKYQMMDKLNLVLICMIFFLWNETLAQSDELRVLWKTDAVFMTPESIVFDVNRDCYYVSNFNDQGGFRQPTDSLYDECISRLSADGKVIDVRWVDGLLGPTGMCISGDHLYVVERKGIAVIDLVAMSIIARIPIRGALFLNDISVEENGTIYVSDSAGGTIYRYKDGEMSTWLKDDQILKGVNGLVLYEEKLLAGTRSQKGLVSISLESKEVDVIHDQFLKGIDGIAVLEDGFLISWLSSIRFLNNEGELEELWSSDNKYEWCADFYYDNKTGTLLAPTFSMNSITCFSLN